MSWLDNIPVIGDLIGAATGIADTALSWLGYSKQSDQAEANLKLQKEQFAYQKKLNTQLMAREDSAVTRRVADMKAAGINPVLAAGQPAQAQPLRSAEAPQSKMDHLALKGYLANLGQQMADISKTVAETEHIRNDIEYKNRMATAHETSVESTVQLQAALAAMHSEHKGLMSNQAVTEQFKQLNLDAQTQSYLIDNYSEMYEVYWKVLTGASDQETNWILQAINRRARHIGMSAESLVDVMSMAFGGNMDFSEKWRQMMNKQNKPTDVIADRLQHVTDSAVEKVTGKKNFIKSGLERWQNRDSGKASRHDDKVNYYNNYYGGRR